MDKSDLNVGTGKTYSDLEPIDAARCQAEITSYEPMRLATHCHLVVSGEGKKGMITRKCNVWGCPHRDTICERLREYIQAEVIQ